MRFYLVFFSITVFLFIIINLLLVPLIYKHISIIPTLSISEAPTYKYPEFDPTKVKVLPGSLGVFVSKDSPLFSYIQTENINIYNILGLYLLIVAIATLTFAYITILTGKTNKNAILAGLLVAVGITLIILSIIFLSPAKPGDLICYKLPAESNYIICHTLLEVKDDKVILIRHYDNVTEEVPKDLVVGKIVFIIPPPYGSVLFTIKYTLKFFVDLYSLIIRGDIPLAYKIEYIEVA